MSNILSARVKRIEQRQGAANPYAHLSVKALEASINDLTRAIELEAGVTIDVLAEKLRADLAYGRAPDFCTEHEARLFLAHLSSFLRKGQTHVH